MAGRVMGTETVLKLQKVSGHMVHTPFPLSTRNKASPSTRPPAGTTTAGA